MSERVVVNLRSGIEPRAGEPVPELVDALERLLEKARSGEVQGFVGVSIYRDLSWGEVLMGTCTGSAQAVGGLTKLLHRMAASDG